MIRIRAGLPILVAIATLSGCHSEERGPVLAGGREIKSWVADLHNPKAQIRRQAVLKLGNVGDADPTVGEALAQALLDKDVKVRRDAVRAIAKLSKATDAVTARLKTMSESDRDTIVRDYAQRALARFQRAE